jgi:hypothetical protein
MNLFEERSYSCPEFGHRFDILVYLQSLHWRTIYI